MFEVVKTTQEIQIDERELVSIDEAAKISGRSISAIAAMLERGTLPWYQFLSPDSSEGKRIQRFTSKKAVQQLTKRKTKKAGQ